MRRSLAALAGTVAGVAGLLAYKSGPAPRSLAARGGIGPTVGNNGQAGITPSTAPSTPPTAAAGPRTTTTTAPPQRTVTGVDVPNRFGDVQVQAVLLGNRLIDVIAVKLPGDKPRSQRISDEAAPILRQEALAAQGANIQLLSGATYTSDGYSQSLQSALDAARR
jgi:uncharacterized protein with FMN-binding domain